MNIPTLNPNASSSQHPALRPRSPLNLEGGLLGLLALGNASGRLGTENTTTPLLAGSLVLLEVSLLDGGDELGELVLVLGADLGQGEDGSGLMTELVDM